jgi:hypothetical protein
MISWIDRLNDQLLKTAEWTGKNFKSVGMTVTAIFVLGAFWVGAHHLGERKAASALAEYAPIERDFNTWKTPEKSTPVDSQKKPEEKVPPVDPKALFSRMIEFVKAKGDVPASHLMVLMASEVVEKLGATEQSELLSVAEKSFESGSGLLAALLALKKGDLEANAGQCEKALQTWGTLLSQKKAEYLHSAARLKMGLCFEKLSQFVEAEKFYDQVIQSQEKNSASKGGQEQEFTSSQQWAIREAQKLKRALKWSQQPRS